MANALTGDFDATLQLAAPALNALLAVMHERERGPIHLLHSAGVRLDDPENNIAGFVEVQFAAPTAAVPAGGRARITIVQPFRSRYAADPDTQSLPPYLHGEVAITVALNRVSDARLGATLEVQFNAASLDDIRVTIAPGAPPLPEAAVRLVTTAIRSYVRRVLEPVHERLSLSADVRQVEFRALPHPATPTFAALVSMRRADLPASAADAVTRVLVDDRNGFALALGREYILARFDEIAATIERRLTFTEGVLRYNFTIDDVRLELVPRIAELERLFGIGAHLALTVRGRADAELPFDLGDGPFVVRQALVPVAGPSGLALTAPGDPTLTVEGSAGWLLGIIPGIRDRVMGVLRRQRDALVVEVNAELARVLTDTGPGALVERLGGGAEVSFTGIDIEADGLIARGRVRAEPTAGVVATYRSRQMERDLQFELSALQSWVPGGRIDGFRWRMNGTSTEDRQRFVHEVSLAGLAYPSVCLEVFGTQPLASGGTRTVRAQRCGIFLAGLNLGTAISTAALQRMMLQPTTAGLYVRVPQRQPDPAPEEVRAHIDLLRTIRGDSFNDTNVLLCFESDDPTKDRAAIDAWLASRQPRTPALVVIAIRHKAPNDPWNFRAQTSNVAFAVAEDREHAWAKNFGVEEWPSLVLVSRDGQIPWRHKGPMTEKDLSAIDGHLRGGSLLDRRDLRLSVAEGEQPPDFLFEYAKGHQMALRKLTTRRQPVTICFWTSWSEPSVAELERLAAAAPQNAMDKTPRPLVLAVADREPLDQSQRALAHRKIENVFLVPDPDGSIAWQYGVACWPTTVHVGEQGWITGIQFGRTSSPIQQS